MHTAGARGTESPRAEANEIVFVSPRNYFMFTPMLAASSVGTVEYRSIVEHIRYT